MISAVLVISLLAAVAVARGELAQQGNLRIVFDGKILPQVLPRDRPAPVSVRVKGEVGTVDGTRPPAVREISVAVNRAGKVFVAGLPTCPASKLQQTSTEAALRLCRPALVGHGGFSAKVDFPGAPQIPAHGSVLAFNSSSHGHQLLLLHLYGSSPVRATFILPFRISHQKEGRYGAVFSTRIPNIASDLGYVTSLELTLGRKYDYQGQRRSFLSASCAAAAGFPGTIYQLAKATFRFDDGRHMAIQITRDCQVR